MGNKVRSINRAAQQAQAKEAEITVTLGELFNSTVPLHRLAAQPMPSRLTFALVKTVRAVVKEMNALEETRAILCDNYGKKDEKTGKYKFTKESEAAADKEFNELLKNEVTIKGSKLDLEDLPGLTISASDVILLSWLVE